MDKDPEAPAPPTKAEFEQFVRRIAAVPKAKVDALDAAEKAKRGAANGAKPKS